MTVFPVGFACFNLSFQAPAVIPNECEESLCPYLSFRTNVRNPFVSSCHSEPAEESLCPHTVIPNKCEESLCLFLSFRTNVRNPIEKPLWLGDPSAALRVTLVSLSFRACRGIPLSNLSFRTNVRNPIGKPLELGDPSTSLRVTLVSLSFRALTVIPNECEESH